MFPIDQREYDVCEFQLWPLATHLFLYLVGDISVRAVLIRLTRNLVLKDLSIPSGS